MSKIFRCLLCLFLVGCSVSEGQYAFVSDRPLKLSSLTGKGGHTGFMGAGIVPAARCRARSAQRSAVSTGGGSTDFTGI